MMVKQVQVAPHTHDLSNAHVHTKPLKTGKRLYRYLEGHPLAFWMFTLIGLPIGILFGIGMITALFGVLVSVIAV